MKAAGITAEYNPLHNGHAYQLGEARRLTGADALVVAMSGDFVQRGEPAVTDKWARARAALSCGADLVIEIPAYFCLSDASGYAAASVALLEAAGCGSIVFGSECGDAELLADIAGNIRENRDELEERMAGLMKNGMSYPAARSAAYEAIRKDRASAEILHKELSALSAPNDILAVEYIMHMKKASAVAVRRAGAGYRDGFTGGTDLQSATAVRELLSRGSDVSQYIPEASMDALRGSRLTYPGDWLSLIRYAVMSVSEEEIADCPSGEEGLARLLKKEVTSAESLDSYIKALKSRRYTYTRISRLMMQNLLGIRRKKYAFEAPLYIRVLGFTGRGRMLLADLRKNGCGLPVITNINRNRGGLSDEALKMLALDVYAADVYNLASDRPGVFFSDHKLSAAEFI